MKCALMWLLIIQLYLSCIYICHIVCRRGALSWSASARLLLQPRKMLLVMMLRTLQQIWSHCRQFAEPSDLLGCKWMADDSSAAFAVLIVHMVLAHFCSAAVIIAMRVDDCDPEVGRD